MARFWADALQRETGQAVVVVNRTGGSGAIGHFAGAHARPDGSTLTIITFELCTMHRMKVSRLTFEDYDCLLQMNADPAALFVRQDAPWQNLAEFMREIRQRPGEIRMSGTATGGAWDLARAGLQRAADLPLDSVIWVPHQGSAPSLVELMGGHLDAVCCSLPEAAAQVAGGSLRVLAVMSEERLADFPNIPTVREQGIDWVAVAWRGLALPRGTPPEILNSLKETCLKIAGGADFRKFMAKNGFAIRVREPAEFREFLRQQDEQWNEVVRFSGYHNGLTGNNDPGPLALPLLLSLGLVVGGGIEWLNRRRSRNTGAGGALAIHRQTDCDPGEVRDVAPDRETSASAAAVAGTGNDVLLVVAIMVAYVSLIPRLGFAAATLIFATLLARRFGARWSRAAFGAAVIVLFVWVLFVVIFRVQLPAGVMGRSV